MGYSQALNRFCRLTSRDSETQHFKILIYLKNYKKIVGCHYSTELNFTQLTKINFFIKINELNKVENRVFKIGYSIKFYGSFVN